MEVFLTRGVFCGHDFPSVHVTYAIITIIILKNRAYVYLNFNLLDNGQKKN